MNAGLHSENKGRKTMRLMTRTTLAAGLGLLLWGTQALPAAADSVADFYAGKTVRVLIGTSPGGGYDLYGRLFASHIGKYIPGHPEVIAKNMPGAGQYRAARYLESAAPKDGTVLLAIVQTVVVDDITGQGATVDSSALNWIGRLTSNVAVGQVWAAKGIDNAEGLRDHKVIFGSTGSGDTTDIVPRLLNRYAGTEIQIVNGYKGAAELSLAMERGEIDGHVGSWAALKTRRSDLLKDHKVDVVFQMALERHPDLQDVPTIAELAQSDEGRKALRFISSSADIGRSIVGPPGMPEERVAALRKAFQQMIEDPDLLAEVKKLGVDFTPASGEQLEAIASDTRDVSKEVLANVKAALSGN